MANLDKLDLDDPAPILDDEDDETLAAIDEGIRDDNMITGLMTLIAKAKEPIKFIPCVPPISPFLILFFTLFDAFLGLS